MAAVTGWNLTRRGGIRRADDVYSAGAPRRSAPGATAGTDSDEPRT